LRSPGQLFSHLHNSHELFQAKNTRAEYLIAFAEENRCPPARYHGPAYLEATANTKTQRPQ